MSKKLRSFTELLDEFLQDPRFAMRFLNQALADEDIEAFTLSLKDIMRVYGKISNLAAKAELSRSTIYKVIQGKGQTEMATLLKLIHALGFDLTVTRKTSSQKQLR